MLWPLVNDYLEHLQVEKGFSLLTIRNYEHYLRRFTDWIESAVSGAQPQDITPEVVRKYRLFLARFTDSQGSSLDRLTQGYHLVALRGFLRYLLVQRSISTLSPDRIQLPKQAARTVQFLSTEQLERLLASPDTSTAAGLRDKAILEVLFSTGLRVSELVGLNRDRISLARQEFGVIGKGGKPRVVFLSQAAALWLGRYLESRKDSFKPLFIRYSRGNDPARAGEKMRLSARSVQRIVGGYARECGLPLKVSPHTLRHSFATDLLMGGADLRSVQEMLGHESVRTTQVYTHVTNRQLRQVHQAFHGRGKIESDDTYEERPE